MYQIYENLIVSLVVESFINDRSVCPISLEHDGLLLGSDSEISAQKADGIIERAVMIVRDRIGLEVGMELKPAFK